MLVPRLLLLLLLLLSLLVVPLCSRQVLSLILLRLLQRPRPASGMRVQLAGRAWGDEAEATRSAISSAQRSLFTQISQRRGQPAHLASCSLML